MFVLHIIALLAGFFRACITPVKGNPDAANIEQAGAMVPNGALVTGLAALQNNASPAFGNWSATVVPNSAAATYSGNSMVGGIIQRFSPGAAFTDCTDTGTNIVNAIPGAKVGQSFPMFVANLGSGLGTLSAATGVTIAGTATISSNSTRLFLGQVTGSAAVTLSSMFQFSNGPGL